MKNVKRTAWLAVTVLAACQGLAAQEPSERQPIPLAEVTRTISFIEVDGVPRWLGRPVGAADRVSFTTSRLYKHANGACTRVAGDARKDVRNVLFEHLLPVLGQKDTLALLEPLVAETVLVSAEVGTLDLPEGADRRGNVVACLGWRAPVRSIVEKFDPLQQGRIEWVLIRPIVNWQPVKQAPDWASKLPVRAGYFRCAFAHACQDTKVARASAIGAARRDVLAHVAAVLTPAVGKERAEKAAAAGVMRLGAVARAYHGASRKKDVRVRATAYCLWEVPVAPMLLTLPEGLRKVAEYQLEQRQVVQRR